MKKYYNKNKLFTFSIYKVFIIGLALFLTITLLYQNSSLFYRRVIVSPFSLHLNKQELYLVKGQEFRLFVYAINKRVSYSSTNFRVAGVNFNGRVFAHRTGTAFIIAKVDGKLLKCRVHVFDINKEKLVLKVGETERLKIIGAGSFGKWKSTDSKVASVNMFGKVKAKKKGNTIIYAKIKGKKVKCSIWVK